MGGEKWPLKKVTPLCADKHNWLFLSHEDWDHVNAIKSFQQRVRRFCLFYPQQAQRPWIHRLKKCPPKHPLVTTLYTGTAQKGSNASSVVYRIGRSVLLPGDSLKQQEQSWVPHAPPSMRIIILGHHGSQTSTSPTLLKKIQPKMAIVSARKSKYGHPHPRVIQRLKKQRVPMLSTETLGDLYFNIQLKN